jgi:hypothetical protein
MSKKYIIANIRMPIELLEDGTITSLKDHAHIELESCKELPPIQENMSEVMNINNIKLFIEKQELSCQNKIENDIKDDDEKKEVKLWIHPNEIKPSTNKYCNTTIKNIKPNKMKRYSVKNIKYSNNI